MQEEPNKRRTLQRVGKIDNARITGIGDLLQLLVEQEKLTLTRKESILVGISHRYS